MTHRQTRTHCQLDEAGPNLLRATMTELGLSARRTTRFCVWPARLPIWTPARTSVRQHLSEAINYRMLDRQMWT